MSTDSTSVKLVPDKNNSAFISAALSYEDRIIMETLSYVFLSGSFCLLGIGSNVINIAIFIKQGLNTTMNISFFALAVSDLLSIVSLQWSNVCVNPLFVKSDIPFYAPEVQYLTGAAPHVCFGHITCWITAYMTAERCLCIALPLKVKKIVTPGRTTLIICVMYAVNMACMIPVYASVYIDWKFYPERNKSLLALAVSKNKHEMEGLGFIFLAVLGLVPFPAVILFTFILTAKLRQQARWRKQSTTDNRQFDATSKRDIRAMNMVVLIAVILIVCYTPEVLASLATYSVPGFNIVGSEVNLFFALWGFVFWLESVNSSVNIFLYYKMSTKFRNSFKKMFGRCMRAQGLHSQPLNEEEIDG